MPEELLERILKSVGTREDEFGTFWCSTWEKCSKKELDQCALVNKHWATRFQAKISRKVDLRSAEDVREPLALLNHPGTTISCYIEQLCLFVNLFPKAPWAHLVPSLYRKLPSCGHHLTMEEMFSSVYSCHRKCNDRSGHSVPLTFTRAQSILVSRFLINLRRAHQLHNQSSLERFSRFSTPRFHVPTMASIVDDLGEPLEHVDYEGDHELSAEEEEDKVRPAHTRGHLDNGSMQTVRSNARLRSVAMPLTRLEDVPRSSRLDPSGYFGPYSDCMKLTRFRS